MDKEPKKKEEAAKKKEEDEAAIKKLGEEGSLSNPVIRKAWEKRHGKQEGETTK